MLKKSSYAFNWAIRLPDWLHGHLTLSQ